MSINAAALRRQATKDQCRALNELRPTGKYQHARLISRKITYSRDDILAFVARVGFVYPSQSIPLCDLSALVKAKKLVRVGEWRFEAK